MTNGLSNTVKIQLHNFYKWLTLLCENPSAFDCDSANLWKCDVFDHDSWFATLSKQKWKIGWFGVS